jgi:hypothetical protein
MRLPRVRFSVWTMMVAVAAFGLVLGGAIAFIRRSYPTDVMTVREPGCDPWVHGGLYQAWTDGWIIRVDESHPCVRGRAYYGPLTRVEWSNGSTGWYWTRPYVWHSEEKLWDGSRTWHLTAGKGLLGGGGTRRGPFPHELPPR